MKHLMVVLVALVLSSCISLSTSQKHPDAVSNFAVVYTKDTFLNYPKANGAIRIVDGEEISTYVSLKQPKIVQVAPGYHEITVAFYSKGYAFKGNVKGTLEESMVYEIVGVEKERPFYTVTLEEVVGDRRRAIFEEVVEGYPAH